MFLEAKRLTIDVQHLQLLRTFDVAPYGDPMTYSQVKTKIEFIANIYNREDFEGGKLKLDQTFKRAINAGEIKHVRGGYVITPKGHEEIPVVEDRVIRKLHRDLECAA